MRLVLTKKPKGVRIVEGFPGFGLIGTIATEFLVEHLKCEKIGTIDMDDIPAIIAIHQKKVIEPISIYYHKKLNIVLLHAINIGKELGWKLAEVVQELAQQLRAKEIISLEGVGNPQLATQGAQAMSRVFYYTSDGKKEKVLAKVALPLEEGIIVGVTGALLARTRKVPITAFFAETGTGLPDSKAAALIIKALDQYTGLDVDYKPLFKQAEEFEKKLRGMMEQAQSAEKLQDEKKLSYVG